MSTYWTFLSRVDVLTQFQELARSALDSDVHLLAIFGQDHLRCRLEINNIQTNTTCVLS